MPEPGITRWGCTCPDWLKRSEDWRAHGGPRPELCKHQWAVIYAAQRLPRSHGSAGPTWDGTCPKCGGGTVCRLEPYGGSVEPPRLVDLCLCGWSQEARPRRQQALPREPERPADRQPPQGAWPRPPLPRPNRSQGVARPARERPPAPMEPPDPPSPYAEGDEWDWGDLLEGPAPPPWREKQFLMLL